MIIETFLTDRASVRKFVSQKAASLTAAQAGGALARRRLDIRDEGEGLFNSAQPEGHECLKGILAEEIDALCLDLRLASVTVQQQIERKSRRVAAAIIFGIGAFVLAFVPMMAANASLGLTILTALVIGGAVVTLMLRR